MLRFDGSKELSASPDTVRAKLGDFAFLTSCIPDSELMGVGVGEVKFRVRPGFSFARGSLDVDMTKEAGEPDAIVYRMHSKGIGSSSDVRAMLRPGPHPKGEGCVVTWSAEVVSLGGLLKAVPAGLIKAAAQKVIGDVWNEIDAKLKEEG